MQLLFAIFFIAVLSSADGDMHRAKPYTTQEYLLRKDMFANYDKTMRPQKNKTDPVLVVVAVWPRTLYLNEHENYLEVNCWFVVLWEDESLSWETKKYDSIYRLSVDSSHLWLPDIAIYTASDMRNFFPNMDSSKCQVYKTGEVFCAHPSIFQATCISDLTRWPFDVQNCSLRIGSHSMSGNELDLAVRTPPKQLLWKYYLKGRTWNVLDISFWRQWVNEEEGDYPYISCNFILKRHAGAQLAVVVVPGLVLATLTVASFWLELGSVERVAASGTNVLCHLLYLTHLASHLPSVGDRSPLVVLFFRDSLLMVALSLVTSVVLHVLALSSRPPPSWLQGPLSKTQRSRAGQLLLQALGLEGAVMASEVDEGGEGAGLVFANSPQLPWKPIAALTDRVLLVTYVGAYAVLILRFL